MTIYNLANEQDIQRIDSYLARLKKSGSICELRKPPQKRSNPSNAYFHVGVSVYALDAGWTLEEAKIIIKRNCPICYYEKEGNKFLRSTADLNQEEFNILIDSMRNFLAKEGVYLLSPEEYRDNPHQVDEYIKRNKQWLVG